MGDLEAIKLRGRKPNIVITGKANGTQATGA